MKKRLLTLIFSILIFSQSVFALQKVDIKAGPWITNVHEDQATIMWVSSSDVLGCVEVGEDDGSTFYCRAKQKYYQSVTGRKVIGKFHAVTVTGLKPGTKYIYRILTNKLSPKSGPFDMKYEGVGASKPSTFKTLDSKAEECRFSVVNDIHFKVDLYAELMKDVNADNTDFMVLNGDMVTYSKDLDTLLHTIVKPVAGKVSTMPVVNVRGNHETRGFGFEWFGRMFPTPTGEPYYTFRHGPVGFVVLDGAEDKPDNDPEYFETGDYDQYRAKEAEWLKAAVKDPMFASAPVKICLIHIPTLNEKDAWYAQREVTRLFGPTLEQAGIDLMLSGHHHKHFVVAPCERGNGNYSILVNSNTERLDVRATKTQIFVDVFDASGVKTHSYTFDVK